MPLIKTIAEVAAVLPKLVSKTNEFEQLPDFQAAEDKYIIPIIGQTLYDALVAAYDGDTLDANETELVAKLRRAIVPYAFLEETGLNILMWQGSGLQKVKQSQGEPVRAWEIQEMKTTLLKKATEGIEHSLRYLFDNADIFPEWTASAEYDKLKVLLIKSGTELNELYSVYQPQRSYFIMKSLMYDMQRMALQDSIGTDLLTYLRDKETPSTDEAECIGYLKKALAFLTIQKACRHFSVSFSDMGFTILGERNSNVMENSMNQPTDLQLLEMKIRECEKEAVSYMELARTSLVTLYAKDGTANDYKTAFAAGPLTAFVKREDRTSGNENRKFYSLP